MTRARTGTRTVARAGAISVAELVLVMSLFAVILLGIATSVALQQRLAAGQRDLHRYGEARRTAEVILGRGMRTLMPADVRVSGTEILELRAIRGGGRICSVDGPEVVIRYAGVRNPDASKDSVVLVRPDGEEVWKVRAVGMAAACGGEALRITLEQPAAEPAAAWALVFESGSYHASEGALRYRRGGAGRQPLTEGVFTDMRLQQSPERRGFQFHSAVNPDSLPNAPRTVEMSFPLLNSLPE